MSNRIDQLASQLSKHAIDALLVTDEINVRYLTGFTGDSSSLLVGSGAPVMISDGRYKEQLADECPGLATAIRSPKEQTIDYIAEVISGAGYQRVGIEADVMNVTTFASLKQKLSAIEWTETAGIVGGLRMIKDAGEIEILRDAVRINERALQSVLAKLGPDWTEQEICYELESAIRRMGATGFSFEPIVGAGPGGAKPHYRSGQIVIGDHESLLIDWGTCLGGYASDLTRTFHFGNPPARFPAAYEAVLEAQMAGIAAIAPGVKCSDVDQIARNVLEKAGLGEYFIHGLGHGVGLRIHEQPRFSSVSDEILEAGMVMTVEPGVYFEGEFGIRIEDDILVTETGHEVISRMPKGLDDCALIL